MQSDVKTCKICGIEKPQIECVIYQKICKPCKSIINKGYYNKTHIRKVKEEVKEVVITKRPVGRPKKGTL